MRIPSSRHRIYRLLSLLLIVCLLLAGCGQTPAEQVQEPKVSQTIGSAGSPPAVTTQDAANALEEPNHTQPGNSEPASSAPSASQSTTHAALTSTPSIRETAGSTQKTTTNPPSETAAATTPSTPSALSAVETKLRNMTTEEKVGQLFFLRPESLVPSGSVVTKISDAMRQNMQKYHVGGIILFSRNIQTPSQTKQLIQQMQAASKTGLLIGIDEEGGRVARIGNNTAFDVPSYPDAGLLAQKGETAVYDASRKIGSYLKTYGFNVNFAPVSDVNTNPDNPVIGTRAFGSDPKQVAALVRTAVRGFHDGGVLCTVKHFPGHGDTASDSHLGSVSISKTLEELQQCEFLPFQAGISQGVDMVMIGHITASKVTGDTVPASLSRKMVTGVLREKLHYSGVVITDGMEMKAITSHYSSGAAAVMAIQAGVDLLLCPPNFEDAYRAVLQAVQSGKISEARLNESVTRILKLKQKAGVL